MSENGKDNEQGSWVVVVLWPTCDRDIGFCRCRASEILLVEREFLDRLEATIPEAVHTEGSRLDVRPKVFWDRWMGLDVFQGLAVHEFRSKSDVLTCESARSSDHGRCQDPGGERDFPSICIRAEPRRDRERMSSHTTNRAQVQISQPLPIQKKRKKGNEQQTFIGRRVHDVHEMEPSPEYKIGREDHSAGCRVCEKGREGK